VTTLGRPRRYIVVTGATSGIGLALAAHLAGSDVTVAIVGRDSARLAAVRDEITAARGGDAVRAFSADLSRLQSVRSLGAELAAAVPRIDGLVHCAAVYSARRVETPDGLEAMFATNVAAPFLLTNLLLPSLTGGGRVLVVSAPSTTPIDLDDLQARSRFQSLTAFGATKSADLVLTFELARRVAGIDVTANAVHPGLVRTNLMREAPAPIRWVTWLLSRSPERAVVDIAPLLLADAYAGITGRFFHRGLQIEPPPNSTDPEIGRRLWQACVDLTGITT
jgi:retinol dehydrogenase 14